MSGRKYKMIPTVFIGSSTESLNVAKRLQKLLGPQLDCSVWSESFFSANDSTLDVLLKKSALYDAGIILLTKDDKTLIRKKRWITPRDNTIFEAGLFFGRLGKGRTFLLVEDKVKLPSDIIGITVLPFKRKARKGPKSLIGVASDLTTKIMSTFAQHYLGLLPSTTLAIGYFYNFIKPVAEEIVRRSIIQDNDGKKKYPIRKLIMLMPNDSTLDIHAIINTEATRCHWHEGYVLRNGQRDFNVRFSILNGKAEIQDIPSTLRVIGQVVGKVFAEESVAAGENMQIAISRELANFQHAIECLIKEDTSVRSCVSIRQLKGSSRRLH